MGLKEVCYSYLAPEMIWQKERRKADEGVRIANLDPETRMNSKDEFMQGTNLFLVPVRGVGL